MNDANRYPAPLLDRLTPIYDLFARLFMPEKRFKRDLIAHARIAPSHHVLDLGAGTGALAIMIKQIQPGAQVIGLDGERSGGELHIADFDTPHTGWGQVVAPLVRRFQPISDNLDGLLPYLFQDAGFVNAAESRRYTTLFGTISILSGQKP